MKLRSNVLVASSNRLSLARALRLELREVKLERQVLFGDVVLVADRDEPLDQVLELADVARPPVLLQHRHRRVGDALDRLPEPRVVAAQEELGELRDVLGALAQRRQLDRDDVDPVVEVLAEPPFLDRLLEIDVGRRDQAELGLDRLGAADALDLAFLNRAQQLGLQVEPQVADLVEEQRAVRRQLELAELLPVRAGERAALVAEQRALGQLARNRGQVDGDERRVADRPASR